jgi:hypothetical protein
VATLDLLQNKRRERVREGRLVEEKSQEEKEEAMFTGGAGIDRGGLQTCGGSARDSVNLAMSCTRRRKGVGGGVPGL